MKRTVAISAVAGLLAFGIAALPFKSPVVAKKSQVTVHCPNGNTAAFVTPPKITIAVGDSIIWRVTGQATDTLAITLKDAKQAWPFTGAMPAGASDASTGAARTRGTYGYNVIISCRLPGGGSQRVVIDPDIIIE